MSREDEIREYLKARAEGFAAAGETDAMPFIDDLAYLLGRVEALEASSTEAWSAARRGTEANVRAVALLRVAATTATSTVGITFALGARQAYGVAADLLLRGSCDLAPQGWVCSRAPGHDGPCAAHEIPAGALAERGTP